jgi:hypothetical protein
MTETTETQAKGDKRNIPEALHRRASALSRQLMRQPDGRESNNQESPGDQRAAEGNKS